MLTFGLSLDEADWPTMANELVAPRADGTSLCDLIYGGSEDIAGATLGDIRASGRPLIWVPDGDLRAFLDARGDCPTSNGAIHRVWSIAGSPDVFEQALTDSVDTRDPNQLLIKNFAFSLDGTDSTDQVEIILGYMGTQDASIDLGFSGDFPSRLIAAYDDLDNMNILAGAYYEDTDLVEAAIAENTQR